jgi:hypothetical protein
VRRLRESTKREGCTVTLARRPHLLDRARRQPS